VHSLLHDAVDHVRDAKTSLAATALGDPHAPNESGLVAPIEQRPVQARDDVVEVVSHLGNALAVHTRSSVVVSDALESVPQVHFIRYCFHRHRRQDVSLRARRPRHRQTRGTGPSRTLVVDPRRPGGLEAGGWPAEQIKLSCLFVGRGFRPYPISRRFHLSTVFWYHETIGLLSSHYRLVASTITARSAEAERSPRVRTQNFTSTPSPVPASVERQLGFAAVNRLTPDAGFIDASLMFGSTLH
jgi:hypothetical protein